MDISGQGNIREEGWEREREREREKGESKRDRKLEKSTLID